MIQTGSFLPPLPLPPQRQRRLQPRVEFLFVEHGQVVLASLEVVAMPVGLVVELEVGSGGEEGAGGRGGGQRHDVKICVCLVCI